MKSRQGKIVVLGSLNIDFIAAVKSLPEAGETVAATELVRRFGGKGANQAIAAARQGAEVSMIGAMGNDRAAAEYLRHLKRERISTKGVSTADSILTGTALIAVDDQGENMIIVSAGANGTLTPESVRSRKKQWEKAAFMLTQFEIPFESVEAGIKCANSTGAMAIVNASPYREGFPWGKVQIDSLITNELEARAIFGMSAAGMSGLLSRWRKELKINGVERLIVTRGSSGTLCLEQESFFEEPAFKVRPVDTVGAGDAFAGTFAARRARGDDIRQAVRFANAAGALATLRRGAQAAIPTERGTAAFIRKARRGDAQT